MAGNDTSWALDSAQWRPKNLDLEITGLCNQHCKFCYLEKLDRAQRGHMSMEVAEQVLQYIALLARSLPKNRHISLCLFGGEPFLNFPVVQYLIEEADKRGLPTGRAIFTNGATAKPEQIEWCKTHRIISKRSTAGCPESAALTRPGDYMERYHAETKLWDDYHRPRRICIIPANAQYIMDNVRYFYRMGYWGMLDFATDDYADWTVEQMKVYKDQTERLAKEFVRQFHLGHIMGNEVLQLYGKKMFKHGLTMTLGCGAGWGLQGISWEGYVLPCHRMFGEQRDSPMCGGKLSDVLAGKPATFGQELREHIYACANRQEQEQCRKCVARQCCQHGCRHLSWAKFHDLSKTPEVRCEFTRHWRRLASWVHSQLGNFEPAWYERRATKCGPIPDNA